MIELGENKRLKVAHIAFSDVNGGASRAAYRVHKSLIKNSKKLNIDSFMRVISKISDDYSIISGVPNNNKLYYSFHRFFNKLIRVE